jgi:hypothetical protein
MTLMKPFTVGVRDKNPCPQINAKMFTNFIALLLSHTFPHEHQTTTNVVPKSIRPCLQVANDICDFWKTINSQCKTRMKEADERWRVVDMIAITGNGMQMCNQFSILDLFYGIELDTWVYCSLDHRVPSTETFQTPTTSAFHELHAKENKKWCMVTWASLVVLFLGAATIGCHLRASQTPARRLPPFTVHIGRGKQVKRYEPQSNLFRTKAIVSPVCSTWSHLGIDTGT